MDAKKQSMSHEERLKRREEIAVAIGSGEPIGAVAKRYGVTINSVRQACKENQVKVPAAA